MRIFLTGATGFIGSRIVPELLAAGHHVLGLTRSDAGAAQLRAAGADVHRGTLEDPATLAAGAAQADAVIHTAFDHDMTNFLANIAKDEHAIRAMGEALRGTAKPLIVTSGIGMGSPGPGQTAVERVTDWNNPNPRIGTERAAQAMADRGVSVAVVRLPQVHDRAKQGLLTFAIEIARANGAFAYVGEGTNRWSAAPVDDVARLYVLALEHHQAGARWHAVAEEGVPARAIAETIAARIGLPAVSIAPEEAEAKLGWFAHFAGLDMPASSAWTREQLGWTPTGPSLLEDLRNLVV